MLLCSIFGLNNRSKASPRQCSVRWVRRIRFSRGSRNKREGSGFFSLTASLFSSFIPLHLPFILCEMGKNHAKLLFIACAGGFFMVR